MQNYSSIPTVPTHRSSDERRPLSVFIADLAVPLVKINLAVVLVAAGFQVALENQGDYRGWLLIGNRLAWGLAMVTFLAQGVVFFMRFVARQHLSALRSAAKQNGKAWVPAIATFILLAVLALGIPQDMLSAYTHTGPGDRVRLFHFYQTYRWDGFPAAIERYGERVQ